MKPLAVLGTCVGFIILACVCCVKSVRAECLTQEKMQILVCEALCAQSGYQGGTWLVTKKKCACAIDMGPIKLKPALQTDLSEPLMEFRSAD